MNIWFSSDWHAFHENIVRGCSKWDDKSACRDFDSLEEHNETLIENINSCAKANDVIYFNGDFSFGGKQNIYEFRKRIVCRNIHLILGNHDLHIRKNTLLVADNDENIEARSLFSSVEDVAYRRIGHENFVLCHYAMRTWDRGHHGAIMLYGHSHGSLADYSVNLPTSVNDRDGSFIKNIIAPTKFKTMDIGIDTHKEFRPYHLEEIKKEMSNRIPLRVDHHDDLTT